MSGVYHIVFGTMIALALWKFAGKRWSFGLVIVFSFNSYFGPDFRKVFKELGEALSSAPVYKMGASIHTYLGWVLFSIVYAPLFYGLLHLMDKLRSNNIPGDSIRHPFKDVVLAIMAGGILHLFVDTFGNLGKPPYEDLPKSSVDLLVFDADVAFMYILLAIISLGASIMIYLLSKKKANSFKTRFDQLKAKVKSFFDKRSNLLQITLATGIVCLNTLVLIAVQVAGGFDPVELKTDGTFEYLYVTYNEGDVLQATKFFNDNSSYIGAILLVSFLVLLIIMYVKGTNIKIGKNVVRGDVLVMLLFLVAVVVLYVLQPLIGNISGKEADFGSFLYGWCCIFTPIIFTIWIKGYHKSTGLRSKIDS